ncbi:MAG TPA: hypothetical protein VE974_28540 [Thermoanaerobaculia bacterium]|nr:hypothetical protein [Thermoanaerobaculia bacterium]
MILAGVVAVIGATWFPDAKYFWVALFGAIVGASELVSRYRDAPERALKSIPAAIYILFNLVTSVAALRLIEIFDWLRPTDTAKLTGIALEIAERRLITMRVLVAGFGAMTFFRSSLFLTRVGNQDVQVGPVTFLQIVLAAADRAVDRIRGRARAEIAQRCMAGVNFDKALLALPTLSLALTERYA